MEKRLKLIKTTAGDNILRDIENTWGKIKTENKERFGGFLPPRH